MDLLDRKGQNNNETNQNLRAEMEASDKIQRNTINEEDDEGLDQSYATSKINKESVRAESQIEILNKNGNNPEDGEYYNIYQDIEPDEEEGQEFIDFNNQNAYESENSKESQKSEENSQEEIDFNKNNEFRNSETEEEGEAQNKNVSVLQENNQQLAEPNELNKEQIKSNITTKKAAAAAAAGKKNKLAQRPKKKDDLEYKTKKFYEDKRETKTIFSKISEELMYQLTKDKYHKSSSYQFMTNDMYINRVVQKGDTENSSKFENFKERNSDFFNKKKLRLNEKIKKISEAANANVYGIPNKKVFDPAEIRNADEFYENQKNFLLQKQQILEVQRDEALKKSKIEEHGHIPEINEFSRSLVLSRKKTAGEKSEEVFVRLHNQINARHKKLIFDDLEQEGHDKEIKNTVNRASEGKNKAKSLQRNILPKGFANTLRLKGVKKPNAQLQVYSSKLHGDARKKLERNNARILKAFGKVRANLQCKKTKIMNVKKFAENFENVVNKIMAAKTDMNNNNNNNFNNHNKNELEEVIEITQNKFGFNDYCDLLYNLGFTKHNYDMIKTHFGNELDQGVDSHLHSDCDTAANKIDLKALNEKLISPDKKPKLIKKQMQMETKLLKDSWEILKSNSNINNKNDQNNTNYNNNKISEFEIVEPKDALLFLCVVQGFLKGDTHSISAEEENEIQQIKINNLYCELNKAEKTLIKEKNEFEAAKKNMHHNVKSLMQKDMRMKGNLKNVFEDDKIKKADGADKINRFRRVRSKDSYNMAIKKSCENINILDENGENIYKRRKSKNNDLSVNSNYNNPNIKNTNDQEIQIDNLLKKAETQTKNLNSDNENTKVKYSGKSTENKHAAQHQRRKSNKKENSSSIKNTENEINDSLVINSFIKGVDIKNYPYNRTTAKKIKIIFRAFLENIMEHELLMKSIKNNGKRNENELKEQSIPYAYMKKELNPNEKEKNKFYYDRYRQRMVNQLERELDQQKQEAFNTTTETQSNIINNMVSARTRNLKMEDAYEYQRKKREMELKKIREEKEESEMKNCTFQPNLEQLGKKPMKHFNLKALVDKLYKEGLEKIEEKREWLKKIEEEKAQKEMDPRILTFRPKINPLDETVFTPRNIEAYEVSKKNIERLERARIERKIAEIQKQTGVMNLNQINNIDSLLKENTYPAWDFTLETKKYKDTFNDTSRFSQTGHDRKNPSNGNFTGAFNMHNKTKSLNKTLDNNYNTFPNKEKAIYLDVNLNDDSPAKRLKFNLQEDPKITVENFASEYELPEDKKINLIPLIEDKVNEAKLINNQCSDNLSLQKNTT